MSFKNKEGIYKKRYMSEKEKNIKKQIYKKIYIQGKYIYREFIYIIWYIKSDISIDFFIEKDIKNYGFGFINNIIQD